MNIRFVVIVLVASCGGKSVEPTQTSCQLVGERLAVLDAGRMAKFMTEKDRKRRAERWISTCKPWNEAQRKCVLESATLEDAARCTGASLANLDDAPPASKPSIKWLVKAKTDGGIVTTLTFAPDGDVVAAGVLRGTLHLGEQSLTAQPGESSLFVDDSVWLTRVSSSGTVRWLQELKGKGNDRRPTDIWVDDSGGVVVDVTSESRGELVRFQVSADGSKNASSLLLASPIAASKILRDGTIVVGTAANTTACPPSTFPIHRLDARGKVIWSACNDRLAKPALATGSRHLAYSADGSVAFCGSFLGDAPSWAGTKAPETPNGTHAVIATIAASGSHKWSHYVTTSNRDTCNGLVTTSNGAVVAIVDSLPTMSLITWSADGKPGWRKVCTDLAPGDNDCSITAIASSGEEVAFAARNGGHTSIGRIDAATGEVSRYLLEEADMISLLAASGTSTVFGASLHREADFGTGVLTPSNPDSSFGDALLGRM